jgi:hypothetical protein
MTGTVKLEKTGIPGVFLCGDTFREATVSAAAEHSMPSVRFRTIPLADFYKNRTGTEAVRPVAEGIIGDIIEALTSPLKDSEKPVSRQNDDEQSMPIVITDTSYEKAAEEFNRFYLENQWGDGLPLVPPTRERVAWMLSGTKRSPEELIGKVAPKTGMATVGKIAVNAVMAGAKPAYFPVIWPSWRCSPMQRSIHGTSCSRRIRRRCSSSSAARLLRKSAWRRASVSSVTVRRRTTPSAGRSGWQR